jgi:hypothetical protein
LGGINPLWSQIIVLKEIEDLEVKVQFSLKRFDDYKE